MSAKNSEAGFPRVDTFRRAAAQATVMGAGYKGLTIHARPEIHEAIGRIAAATLQPGARVLDVAAGSGAMCLRLRDLGFIPIACDLVTENFRLHDEVEFFELNLNQGFPNCFSGTFDCVIAAEIIEHIENPRYFLRQCFNALRPGGLSIISTPNIASPVSRACYVKTGEFHWFTNQNYTTDGHITPITLFGIRTMMEEAGFAIDAITSVGPIGRYGTVSWKMRLLVKMIEFLARDKPLPGDILVVSGWRPGPEGAIKHSVQAAATMSVNPDKVACRLYSNRLP